MQFKQWLVDLITSDMGYQMSRCYSLQVTAKPASARSSIRPITTAALKVRPYTVRKGDTLDTIAEKRGEKHFCEASKRKQNRCLVHTCLQTTLKSTMSKQSPFFF